MHDRINVWDYLHIVNLLWSNDLMNDVSVDLSIEGIFEDFSSSISGPDRIAKLSQGAIGEGTLIPGLYGENPLIYADYVASGRALSQVEAFMQEKVLPYYANSHTQASFCGAYVTKMRKAARAKIASCCQANDDYSVIFSGSGATNGINRLVQLFGVENAVQQNENPLVIIGPYEHHSNILPWRESGAEVLEIKEAEQGGPDLTDLESALNAGQGRLIVCAFSAASNVTGIISDVEGITQLVNRFKALCVWDYAGGGPYLPINLGPSGHCCIDAVVVSSHKFLGGPGASGVLIVRNDVIEMKKPTQPGGGTVQFVSPWGHIYSDSLIAREESGTPNITGDIRAALCFMVKEAIGDEYLATRQKALYKRAIAKWELNPNLNILGAQVNANKLPIFSFLVFDGESKELIHQQLITRMLSDVYGIQARGGCACAGSYGHNLLNITEQQSQDISDSILSGEELIKPGWTRLNFSVVMTDEKVQYIIDSVDELARTASDLVKQYQVDPQNAIFRLAGAA